MRSQWHKIDIVMDRSTNILMNLFSEKIIAQFLLADLFFVLSQQMWIDRILSKQNIDTNASTNVGAFKFLIII